MRRDWRALVKVGEGIADDLVSQSQGQIMGRVQALQLQVLDWARRYSVSFSTLQMLLLGMKRGGETFADVLARILQRRATYGQLLTPSDKEDIKTMVKMARKVDVRLAIIRDPTWRFTYDASGNVTQTSVTMPGDATTPAVESTHCTAADALHRTTRVSYVTRVGPQPPGTVAACSDFAHLTALAEYRYDAANRRVFSNVVGLRETHFAYGAGGQLLAEVSPLGTVERAYVWLDGEPFAVIMANGGFSNRPPATTLGCTTTGWLSSGALAFLGLTILRRRGRQLFAGVMLSALPTCIGAPGAADPTYFFHNDRLGTPIRMTDELGRTVWRAEHRPFGDLESVNTDPDGDGISVENNLRLPGQYDEGLLSLLFSQGPYNNHHRTYDPGNGRYRQPEPILRSPYAQVLYAYMGHSMPVYSYAGNNPIAFVDRNGRYFTSNSAQAWSTLSQLASNPILGPHIERMARDPVAEFTINDSVPFFHSGGGTTAGFGRRGADINLWLPHANSHESTCAGNVPTNLRPMSYAALLAHELGHAYASAYEPRPFDWPGGNAQSVDFENAVRWQEGAPYRLTHDFAPSYSCAPVCQ